jgi:tRNA pseudouridine32 synthase / 23S rRNA pseudouridine746 synthase
LTARKYTEAMPGQALPRSKPYAPPPDDGLAIVYHDDALLAINKPAGLLSVPGRSPEMADCALARVQQRFPQALLVHRLDEATSGLLVFALSTEAQKNLCQAFESRRVKKEYIAMVHGLVQHPQGEIDAALRLDVERRPFHIVDEIHGFPAKTLYSLLSIHEQLKQSRVLLEPITGRTHQLRVHMKHISHPIVGDLLYGEHSSQKAPDHLSRLMLHASLIKLPHPFKPNEDLEMNCPAPF